MAFIFYLVLSFVSYMLLTAGPGKFLLSWPIEEVVAGAVVSILIASLASRFLPETVSKQAINPFRWLALFTYFLLPFLFLLITANIAVAYRVITGRIQPAVVKVDTEFKGGLGTFFMANSITLSPGTLSIALDDDNHSIYVHCLWWKNKKGRGFHQKEVAPVIYYWLTKIFR